jgi:hypothetical protein
MMPTVTAPELYFGVPIVKTEKAADGSLLVYGKATDGSLDLDDQIVDPDFARKALKEWFSDWANVRQMHSGALPPAGIGIELDDREDGQWLTSKVYEPGAVQQVEQKGYKAYSVGIARPRIVRDAKAPGGRIVDGIVVEVSLVDRPANPSCVFALTKGVGKDMQVVAKAVEPAIGKATPTPGRESDFPAGTRFAYTDSSGGKHLPIHDEGHVRAALGRFGQTNFESGAHKRRAARAILGAAKDHGIDVDEGSDVARAAKKKSKGADVPNVTKSDDRMCLGCGHELDDDDKFCSECGKAVPGESGKAARPDSRPPMQPGETPYALRRLHDACCAAYSTDAVKAAYPVLEKNGIGAALGPGARLALWQMLNQEVQEDAGTGTEALDIHHLGEAYKHLGEFISCEAGYPAGADGDAPEESLVMLAAHSDLHAAFAELNKDIMPTGGPDIPSAAAAGQIAPGQFRRPYIAAGHQREDGVGASAPNIPGRTHDLAATDFQRPALTDGQERQSPANAKRAPITAMQALHDRLASQFPELCPMDLHPATIPNRDSERPEPKQMGAEPTLTKAEKDAAAAEAEIAKANRKAKKRSRREKALAPAMKKIAELQATVEKLSREPDPNRAAHRGVTTATKAASPQAQKRAEDDERELREMLQEQAQHGDPQTRLRAQDRLVAKGWAS